MNDTEGKQLPVSDEDRLFIERMGLAILHRPVDAGLLQNCLDLLADGASRETITQILLASEEAAHQAAIPLFVPPGHYYSPVCRPDALRPKNADASPASVPGISIDHEAMVDLWSKLVPAMGSHPFSAKPKTGMRYSFENEAYSWGDGLILHAMIRHLSPRRIVEVGSGWSSACIIDTLETSEMDQCALTLIDIDLTFPRSLTDRYAGQIDLFEQPVQQVDPAIFNRLESGDILFIDSSHILKTDSDLN